MQLRGISQLARNFPQPLGWELIVSGVQILRAYNNGKTDC